MAGTQVMRMKLRKTLDVLLYRHNLGVSRPPTRYDVRDDHGPVVVFRDDLKAGRRAVSADKRRRDASPVGGRPPKECLELVFAGPPKYADDNAWDDARVEAWAREVDAWMERTMGPESVFVVSALHRDESSPHLHFLVVPVHEGRISWTALKNHAAEKLLGRPPAKRADAYRALQDDLHRQVSAKYGLARGQVGSEATHAGIDRVRAAQAAEERAAKDVERMRLQVEADVEAAKRQAEDVERKARDEARAVVGEAVDEAQALREGDVALAKSKGILPSKEAAAGRALREGWERQAELLRAEVAAAEGERDEAVRRAEAEAKRVAEVEAAGRAREQRLAESVAEQRRRRAEAEAALERVSGELRTSEAHRQKMREREGQQWKAGRSSRSSDVHGRESDLANAQARIASLERERDGARRKGIAAFVNAFAVLLVRHGLGEAVQEQPEVRAALRDGVKGRLPGEAQAEAMRRVEAGKESL